MTQGRTRTMAEAMFALVLKALAIYVAIIVASCVLAHQVAKHTKNRIVWLLVPLGVLGPPVAAAYWLDGIDAPNRERNRAYAQARHAGLCQRPLWVDVRETTPAVGHEIGLSDEDAGRGNLGDKRHFGTAPVFPGSPFTTAIAEVPGCRGCKHQDTRYLAWFATDRTEDATPHAATGSRFFRLPYRLTRESTTSAGGLTHATYTLSETGAKNRVLAVSETFAFPRDEPRFSCPGMDQVIRAMITRAFSAPAPASADGAGQVGRDAR